MGLHCVIAQTTIALKENMIKHKEGKYGLLGKRIGKVLLLEFRIKMAEVTRYTEIRTNRCGPEHKPVATGAQQRGGRFYEQ
jgi:hypothetical protein